MCAAIAAKEAGAEVLILEKRGVVGGNSVFPRGGGFGVNSKYHQAAGLHYTTEEVFRCIMEYSHWRGNAELARTFVEGADETIAWLEGLGVRFRTVPPAYIKMAKYATGVPLDGTGADVVTVLKGRCQDMGIPIRLHSQVKHLVVRDGAVCGVTLDGPEEEEIIEAGAVVVATGGFADNPEMVRRYSGGLELGKTVFPMFKMDFQGDGIQMAWEAGAASDGLGLQLVYSVPGTKKLSYGLPGLQGEPLLLVNTLGQRFFDESDGNGPYKGNALARQPGGYGVLIFDEQVRERLETRGFFFHNPFFPDTRLPDFDETIRQLHDSGNPYAYGADTLEELADWGGIDPRGLQQTVARYNDMCRNGVDTEFYKPAEALEPVAVPRFYGLKLYPHMYGTMGGIQVNGRMQAIGRDGRPIPGLYSAGYDANGVLGRPMPDYTVLTPGLTFGFALTSGRLAGISAAAIR